MDQKLFEQRLSEVAEWHRERHRGQSKSGQTYGDGTEERDPPTYIHIDRFKTKPCPYQADKKDCFWKIYKKQYSNMPKVLIQKCETCGAIKTPKGHYVSKPNGFNYPKIILEIDDDE